MFDPIDPNGDMPPIDRNAGERYRQLMRLRAAAPLRRPVEQHGDEGLALFDSGRQGELL